MSFFRIYFCLMVFFCLRSNTQIVSLFVKCSSFWNMESPHQTLLFFWAAGWQDNAIMSICFLEKNKSIILRQMLSHHGCSKVTPSTSGHKQESLDWKSTWKFCIFPKILSTLQTFFLETMFKILYLGRKNHHISQKRGGNDTRAMKLYGKLACKLSGGPWKFACKVSREPWKFKGKTFKGDWNFQGKLSIQFWQVFVSLLYSRRSCNFYGKLSGGALKVSLKTCRGTLKLCMQTFRVPLKLCMQICHKPSKTCFYNRYFGQEIFGKNHSPKAVPNISAQVTPRQSNWSSTFFLYTSNLPPGALFSQSPWQDKKKCQT